MSKDCNACAYLEGKKIVIKQVNVDPDGQQINEISWIAVVLLKIYHPCCS